jgi:hypothetical protein
VFLMRFSPVRGRARLPGRWCRCTCPIWYGGTIDHVRRAFSRAPVAG